MTAHVLDDRRAKAFAEALDAPEVSGRARRNDALGELLGTVDALGRLPVPALDPEVRTVQRARLVAAFENALAEAGGSGFGIPEQKRGGHRATRPLLGRLGASGGRGMRWGRRLALGGVVAGMALGAFGGVAAASSSALPGDPLYGMKRGLEDWRLSMAGSDAERGRLLLDQASTRMGEAQQLVEHGGGPGRLSPHLVNEVRQVLAEMNAEGAQGRDLLRGIYLRQHSLAPMQRLAAFATAEQRRLASLTPELPPALDPVAARVAQLLNGIRDEVAPLRLTGSSAPDGGRHGTGPTAPESGPRGTTTSGTGGLHGGGARGGASPSSGGPVGGLVNGLTGGVLGSGGAPGSSGSASAGPSGGSSGTASPSPGGQSGSGGVSIPPLLPGLLPGVSVGLGDGG